MNRPAFSLYDASAGSGKTFTLVKEYLSIILSAKNDDAYRHILAITFTNKAVHEMKSRIVSTLSDIAADNTSPKGLDMLDKIAEATKKPAAELKEKARRIIRHMIHNYAAFDISTIDKFTHRIIRTFAHDLNLPSTFEVSLDTENLLTEAVDALIARAGEDETLTRLLVDYTMEKTDSDKSWDVSYEIFNTGRLILNENDRAELLHLQDKTIPEFTAIRNKLTETVKSLEAQNTELAGSALELLANHGVSLTSFSGQYFPKHLLKIKNGETLEPKYTEAESIKVNKTAPDGALIESLKPELVAIMVQIANNSGRLAFYHALLRNLTPLSLLNTLQKELAQIQEEQNILSISEFNKLINDQIRDQPAPFIYERLGDRYRHFFIDEFQDTSVMQWQNLVPLIDNATSSEELSGERGSVMLVGDPKQSIYRWRGGKAEQFIELGKGKHPFNNDDWKPFQLKTNWRSYSQVIEFNNDFFSFIANRFEHEDYKKLYAAAAQEITSKCGGYVQLDFLPKPDTDDEDSPDRSALHLEAVWQTIQDVLAQGFGYGDIAILTRKRGEGIEIASFLTSQNVRIISSETLQVANAGSVRFLIDFLRYLRNPEDVESKSNILYYIGRNQPGAVHDFIAHGLSLDETELERWLIPFGLTGTLSGLRKRSLYETVELLASGFLPADERNAYVQHFLDIVLERETKANSGLSDFLEFWEKSGDKFSVPTPPSGDAIQIMTIHKSKGLEFPIVIFPFADEEYNRKPKDKLWLDAEETDLGLSRVLVDNTKAVEGFGDAASAYYLQKKQEELLDNINILYVALTRAEEQLYIISSMKLKNDGEPVANSMTELFVRYLQHKGEFDATRMRYWFGTPQKCSQASADAEKPKTIEPVTKALDFSNIRIARREAMMWGTKQQKAIDHGNIIHEIMASVATANDIETALASAIESGLIPANELAEVHRTLLSIVSHPELIDHFSSENRVLTERAILQPNATIKPDRLAIRGSDVFLLDYKTGEAKPAHAAQLDTYEQGLREMGFSVVKKTLVYIGEAVNVVNL